MSAVTWQVPGRLEVFGTHTDYAGGNVMVCAIDRGITVTVDAGSTGVVGRSDASDEIVYLKPGNDVGLGPGHWGRYLQTAVNRLQANFGTISPVTVSVKSDLPLASGMSSSSALIVGCTLALADYHGFSSTSAWRQEIVSTIDLAGYLASVERGSAFGSLAGHEGVGTKGGSEDHVAMLCSEVDYLGQFSFNPPHLDARVRLPEDLSFVIAVSGVAAEKTGAARNAYNRASSLVSDLCTAWNVRTGRTDATLAEALASSDEAGEELQAIAEDLGQEAVKRLAHFRGESQRIVPGAMQALQNGDLNIFGAWSDESQDIAARLLGNQIPETVMLASTARKLGALGAASFGAGYGGSVWALVPTIDADAFADQWVSEYRRRYPDWKASSIVTRPAASARRV